MDPDRRSRSSVVTGNHAPREELNHLLSLRASCVSASVWPALPAQRFGTASLRLIPRVRRPSFLLGS